MAERLRTTTSSGSNVCGGGSGDDDVVDSHNVWKTTTMTVAAVAA